jgi:surfeit locus 1 family protein
MSRRTIVFCTFAVLAAALFARLGVWQLARLHEKVQRIDEIVAQQRTVPVEFGSLPRDTGLARYRAARVNGRFDYDQEIVLSGRSFQGSPGVNLITPVRVAGSDTAVLVNRGWVYSPDGARVDRKRWREKDSGTVTGFVQGYMPDEGVTAATADPRIVRRVSRSEIASKITYPVAPYYLVATGDSADGDHPARLTLPPLDEGSHRGYAFQWFSFAAIALVGAGIMIRRDRRPDSPHRAHGPPDAGTERAT